MKYQIMLRIVIVLTSSLVQLVEAQTITTPNTIHSREQTIVIAADDQQAKSWGLKADEWSRYRDLMMGPLGVYSPNLDPFSALGIEARSEEELHRYAALQVQAEARRVEKLLAYQRAYDAAWKRLYPTLQPVNLTDANSILLKPDETKRLAVFVKDNCSACDQRVKQLQASGTAFDLYLVDSRDDDMLIRAWAKRVDIVPAHVKARIITLNHDNGYWLSLGLSGDLPAIVNKVNGQWQRQP